MVYGVVGAYFPTLSWQYLTHNGRCVVTYLANNQILVRDCALWLTQQLLMGS
jgi:hypothetical protein